MWSMLFFDCLEQMLSSLTQLSVQLDRHELNFRISRFDVNSSQEEAEGVVQLPFAVVLPPSADQGVVALVVQHGNIFCAVHLDSWRDGALIHSLGGGELRITG